MGKNLLERTARANADLLTPENQAPVVDIRDGAQREVASMQSQLAALMPSDGETGRRIVADAVQLMRTNDDLCRCDPVSVLGGLATLAQLNLRPGVGGEAWLIPMNVRKRTANNEWVSTKTAQLIIGYQGVLTLARRSEQLGDVQVIRIYENDEFEFAWDYDRLVHRVNWQDPGEVIGWYAVVKLSSGLVRVVRPWSLAQMKEHRDRFAMAKKKDGTVVGPWRDNFNAMGDKTVLLHALKTAPRSYELQAGLYADGTVRQNTDTAANLFEVASQPQLTVQDGDEDVPSDTVSPDEENTAGEEQHIG